MSVAGSTLVLGLAWFAVVNLAVSVACGAAVPNVLPPAAASRGRAHRLMALRLLPAVTAIVAAGLLFAPAHLRLEPPDADERYGVIALALASAGALLIVRSASRAIDVARGSWRLAAAFRRRRCRSGIVETNVPLAGGIALAGVFRPRVLIGARARRALTAEELEVAIGHEVAHWRAADNLTKALMACAPDFLGLTAAGRRLERLWQAEVECLADAVAVGGSAARARHLASALLKVARLIGGRAEWSPAWSLLHEPVLLERRVRLLLDVPPVVAGSGPRAVALACALALGAGVLASWMMGVPGELHRLSELALARLP